MATSDSVEKSDSAVQPARPSEVRFEYIKSNLFRVVHADGIHGGLAPSGTAVHMAIFNDRLPIPDSEIFAIKDGRVGEQKSAQFNSVSDPRVPTIIRELEVSVLMPLEAARQLHEWLGKMLKMAETVQQMASALKEAEDKMTEEKNAVSSDSNIGSGTGADSGTRKRTK